MNTIDVDFASRLGKQDRADLENERAGRENTGRVKRFLVDAFGECAEAVKKRRQRDMDRVSLEAMLLRKAYAERYNRVIDKLSEAEQAVEAALGRVEAVLDKLYDQRDDFADRATRNPDGKLVFYTEDGVAMYADGSPVDPVTALTISERSGAPSYEEWLANQQAIAQAQAAQDELEGIRDDILAPIRVEIQDEDNPPTPGRLEEIEEEIDAAGKRVGELSAKTDAPAQRIVTATGPQDFATPDLEALLPG